MWFAASLLVAAVLVVCEGGLARVVEYLNDLFFITPPFPGLF